MAHEMKVVSESSPHHHHHRQGGPIPEWFKPIPEHLCCESMVQGPCPDPVSLPSESVQCRKAQLQEGQSQPAPTAIDGDWWCPTSPSDLLGRSDTVQTTRRTVVLTTVRHRPSIPHSDSIFSDCQNDSEARPVRPPASTAHRLEGPRPPKPPFPPRWRSDAILLRAFAPVACQRPQPSPRLEACESV